MTKLSEAFRKPAYAGGNPSKTESLVWAFRFHRATHYRWKAEWRGTMPAKTALDYARGDVAAGKTRYPSSARVSGYNQPFTMRGAKAMRWIEKPSAAGLRFVGYADKLASIGHTGWYVDNDQSETVRGVVFQLPGRNGKPLFFAGYEDWNNGKADSKGPVCLDFADTFEGQATVWQTVPGPGTERYGFWAYHDNAADHDAARDAARYADQIADWLAESEREYQAASTAGYQYAELGEEIAATRQNVLAAIGQFKLARRELSQGIVPNGSAVQSLPVEARFGRLCELVRSDVAKMLESISEARAKREKLASGDHIADWLPGWNTSDSRLVEAFNESAGMAA